MSYHISEPYKSPKFGDLIWSNGRFTVYGTDNRFSIYLDDYDMGELINGYTTLNKKFKGKFENWIDFLKNKDINKVYHTRELITEAENTCIFIESLWADIE